MKSPEACNMKMSWQIWNVWKLYERLGTILWGDVCRWWDTLLRVALLIWNSWTVISQIRKRKEGSSGSNITVDWRLEKLCLFMGCEERLPPPPSQLTKQIYVPAFSRMTNGWLIHWHWPVIHNLLPTIFPL